MKKILGLFLCLCLLIGLCAPLALAEEEPEGPLVFSTEDREGWEWNESDLGDYKLIMLNFWEPWCPPCVGEMPDLAKLYEAYRDQGFLILGVYSTEGMEQDVEAVLAEAETGYPILHYCSAFDRFQTGYVPTTVFLNAAGEQVGETEIGSKSYEDWEELITSFDLLGESLSFSTTDREGVVWDQRAFADYSLIMLNFWEPWCPPCVGEMPDLAKLSTAYADRGLLILGVYSTEGMEKEVDEVLAKSGTNYPILHYTGAFDRFQTGYVPTTVFLNTAGETVSESYVGSRSYADWAKIIEGLL